jgi:hypothetical protein
LGDRSRRLCLFLIELAFSNNAAAVTGAAIPIAAAEMPEAAVLRLKVTLLLHIHAIYSQSKNKRSCEN